MSSWPLRPPFPSLLERTCSCLDLSLEPCAYSPLPRPCRRELTAWPQAPTQGRAARAPRGTGWAKVNCTVKETATLDINWDFFPEIGVARFIEHNPEEELGIQHSMSQGLVAWV